MDDDLPEHSALKSAFAEWEIRNPRKILSSGESVTEDGRLVFNLSINDTSFRLLCPANYPNHEDSFFLETECTDFWCVALNEFIIDSPEKLTLDVILAKTFLYYTPASKKSHESSENESENDNENENEGDSDSSENDEWESIISKKKREWREKEGELRLRYNRPKISDMFDGKIMDHPQQVFSNSAASEILINDLINIMGSKKSSGIVVDTVENDICRWSVCLKDFHPHSDIAKDMKETEELFGYSNVQLQLDFAMDLYPSHPPWIRLVRPKLIGVFDTQELVRLANWNPARDMMSVLTEIKDYIEHNGRVDIDNRLNGVNVGILRGILMELTDAMEGETSSELSSSQEGFTAGTEQSPSSLRGKYGAIELILTKFLNCLKNPVCEESSQKKCVTSDSSTAESCFTFNLALNNNLFDEKNHEVRVSETSSYSSTMYEAINGLIDNEKLETQSRYENHSKTDAICDRQHCNIITNPAFGLGGSQSEDSTGLQTEMYSISNVTIHDTNGASNYADTHSFDKSKDSEQQNQTNPTVVSSFNANIKTLEGLSVTASNDFTIELNDNFSSVFKTLKESVLLLFITSELAVDAFFGIWLSTSVHSKIIQILIELASNPYLIDLLASSDIPDLLKIQAQNIKLILEKLEDVSADGRRINQADLDKADLARNIIDTSELVEAQLIKYSRGIHSNKVSTSPNNHILDSDSSRCGAKSRDSIYKDFLSDLKFGNCDIDLETHTFKNDYIADMNLERSYFLMAQEFAFLSKYLPLESTYAIFVRMDKSKPSLMRALITGVEGTLCNGGIFSFDIYLKKDYPDSGLQISTINFCNEETTWLPSLSFEGDVSSQDSKQRTKVSNILQVLTFIQRRKLIPLEICDENWKESGDKKTFLMNFVRLAMINQMRKPPSGFEEVIATHFRIKKDQILSELEQYEFLKNSELLDSLKKEFDNLTIGE